jgi:hypothetical protein
MVDFVWRRYFDDRFFGMVNARRKISWTHMRTKGNHAVPAMGMRQNVSSFTPWFPSPEELTFVSQKPASVV